MKKCCLYFFSFFSFYFTQSQTVYTIPVVVHIMHTGEGYGTSYNPSNEQIIEAISNLNAIYSGSQFGIEGTGDTHIRFSLATRDPDNICTNGILRIDMRNTIFFDVYNTYGVKVGGGGVSPIYGVNEIDLKNLSRWDPAKYCNLWITNKIEGFDGEYSIFASNGTAFTGYSSFPQGPVNKDGIVLLSKCLISTTANNAQFTSLAHEMGHYLNLLHVFQGGVDDYSCACNLCPGDEIAETDQVTKWNFEPRTGENNECTFPDRPYTDSTEKNLMSYTLRRTLFTSGQKARIISALSLPTRSSLFTNNQALVPIDFVDLIILQQSVSPPSSFNNSLVTLTFKEKNIGNILSPINKINIHLSVDDILTPGLNGDVYLGQYPVTQTILPNNETATLSMQILIPDTVSNGLRFIFFAADGAQEISECSEDNNFATAIIQIVNAQSLVGLKYWYDGNYLNSATIYSNVLSDQTVTANLLTASLSNGIHILNVAAINASNIWSSIVSSFFYKYSVSSLLGINKYEYWIDNNYASKTVRSLVLNNNIVLLENFNTTNKVAGLHSLNLRFRDNLGKWSSVTSSFFYKSTVIPAGTAKYEYWMDNNYQNKTQVNNTSTNNFVLLNNISDSGLAQGLHVFSIRFSPDGKLWSSVVSSFFYKTSSSATSTPKYQYWFDNNSQDTVTSIVVSANNYVLLDSLINSLPVGLHTLNIRFKPDGGLWSSVVSNFFYKNQPSGISNNNIARCVYWYDNNWQNPNLLYYTGQSNLSSTINTDAADLNTGMHRVSMMFRDDRGVWSSVVSDSFNRIAATTPTCPINNREFIAGVFLSNTATRQWQLDVGSGFVNISNTSNYSGTNTDTLHISNAPTSWYGYKYRCVLTDGNSTVTGQIYTLKFSLIWNGSADNAWENPANWNCTVLPDANTDVIINPGAAHYPEVNTSGTCRSLTANSGVNVTLKTGSTFIITH